MASKTQLLSLKVKNKTLLSKIKRKQQFGIKYVTNPQEWERLKEVHKDDNIILIRKFYA